MKPKVFISYAREDAPFADELSHALLRESFEVFVDRDDLVAGENWSDRVEDEIRSADVVVLLLSRHTRKSTWVRRELAAALETGDPERVVPVLLDEEARDNPVWPLVANRHPLHEEGRRQTLNAIIRTVKLLSARGEPREGQDIGGTLSAGEQMSRRAAQRTYSSRSVVFGIIFSAFVLVVALGIFSAGDHSRLSSMVESNLSQWLEYLGILLLGFLLGRFLRR